MSDEDDLEDDPDAKALRPLHSKRTIILATVAGAVFGLLLTVFGFLLEHYNPRFRPVRPDAGTPTVPQIVLDDAGASDDPSPWLQD